MGGGACNWNDHAWVPLLRDLISKRVYGRRQLGAGAAHCAHSMWLSLRTEPPIRRRQRPAQVGKRCLKRATSMSCANCGRQSTSLAAGFNDNELHDSKVAAAVGVEPKPSTDEQLSRIAEAFFAEGYAALAAHNHEAAMFAFEAGTSMRQSIHSLCEKVVGVCGHTVRPLVTHPVLTQA